MTIISTEEISNQITGWKIDDEKIEKNFNFANFDEAMVFVNKVADLAKKENHHPEIEIHYSRVEIELSTHSEGGVTEKDINLAKQIDLI